MLLGLGKTTLLGGKTQYPYATGGDYVYLYEDTTTGKTYRVHEFHTTGTSTLNVEVGGQMDVLVVAGGGGGARTNTEGVGGGGGGAVATHTKKMESGTYSITVGGGGLGAVNVNSKGSNGGQSRFYKENYVDLKASGGGGGNLGHGVTGGAGGGAGTLVTTAGVGGGAGENLNTEGEWHAYPGGNGGGNRAGGGGGGAGGTGQSVISNNTGDGGIGYQWYNGKYYAGGGGGAGNSFWGTKKYGIGGLGGGGDGATAAENGEPNTGGGGGGVFPNTFNLSANGGSGIVIVRYVVAEKKLWTPSELTSLKAWYDADSLSLNNNDPITTWTDKSGNGYSLSGSGSARPVYKTNIINNLPVIEFDGVDDYLEASTASDWTFLHSSKSSIFSVLRSNYDTTLARAGLISTGSASNTRGFVWVHEDGNLGLNSLRNYVLTLNGTVGQYPYRNKSAVSSWPSGNIVIASILSDPANATASERSKTWINSDNLTALNVDTDTPSSSDPAFPLRLGKNDFSSSVYLDGWFGELVICNDVISDTDRQKLEGYLAHKWGLTNNLPSGHPYKYEPPYKVEPEEIVTDGLVLNLDAGDYASYPRSGTTWYDISGNGLNGTLTNGPTYDSANKGSIVFDGVNDYILVGRIPYTSSGTQSVTWSLWTRPSSTSGNIMSMSNVNPQSSWNMPPISASGQKFIGKIWNNNQLFSSTYSLDTWYNLTLVWNYSATSSERGQFFYVNGQLVGSQTNVSYSASNASGGNFHFLGQSNPGANNTGMYSGRYGQFSVYNRALSSTEISQNFNALRGRYGI